MTSTASIPAQTGTAVYNSELSAADFKEVSDLVGSLCGIQLTDAKKGLVKSRLQKRLRALRLNEFSEYVRLIKSEQGADEIDELISAISTNVTAFNREPHHFIHFREEVLPGLVQKLNSGESVRIWSAGCSNGSEPYTLACDILDAFPTAGNHDLQILATDIDKHSLATARSGIYTAEMVAKMPSEKSTKWFSKVENGYEIDSSVRSLISFKTLNLMAPWPIKRKYDAIFCRNVMIYFSAEDQSKIMLNFVKHLHHNSHLYIGHSERVIGPAADMLTAVGTTTYKYDKLGA